MRAVGDVMPKGVFRFCRGGNPALRDDLHAVAECRNQLERLAECGFTLIATVNIRMVDRGNAQIDMLFNKARQLEGGHIPVHQTPVAHHKTGEFWPLGGKGNSLNHNIFLKDVMS